MARPVRLAPCRALAAPGVRQFAGLFLEELVDDVAHGVFDELFDVEGSDSSFIDTIGSDMAPAFLGLLLFGRKESCRWLATMSFAFLDVFSCQFAKELLRDPIEYRNMPIYEPHI